MKGAQALAAAPCGLQWPVWTVLNPCGTGVRSPGAVGVLTAGIFTDSGPSPGGLFFSSSSWEEICVLRESPHHPVYAVDV